MGAVRKKWRVLRDEEYPDENDVIWWVDDDEVFCCNIFDLPQEYQGLKVEELDNVYDLVEVWREYLLEALDD